MVASCQQGKHAKLVVERPFMLILLRDMNMAPGRINILVEKTTYAHDTSQGSGAIVSYVDAKLFY